MNTGRHPSAERLRRLLDGRLDGREASSLTAHLERCPSCFEAAEAIWATASPLAEPAAGELAPAERRRIERRLFGRLHRTDLAESVAGLGGRGFLLVILELLKPVLALFARPQSDWRKE